jgi:hypothetical protein
MSMRVWGRSLRAVAECGIPLLGTFDWDHPEFQVGTRRFRRRLRCQRSEYPTRSRSKAPAAAATSISVMVLDTDSGAAM